MPQDKTARLNRLLNGGRCLDIAVDHGVCNEPSFLDGLEDMPAVIEQLAAARPDAIQLNFGQADLLQHRPGRDKPALVMRLDMGNPYNATTHRVMWAVLQNTQDPVLPAIQMDAACVVVNLFMLPDEPDLFRQCVANIARVRADCDRYGMPLMIEPLVMAPHSAKGGYMVDGDAEKIVTLVRLAREMGADIIKADPCKPRAARYWCAAEAGKICDAYSKDRANCWTKARWAWYTGATSTNMPTRKQWCRR